MSKRGDERKRRRAKRKMDVFYDVERWLGLRPNDEEVRVRDVIGRRTLSPAPHRRRRGASGKDARRLELRLRLSVQLPRRWILRDRRAVDEKRGRPTLLLGRSQRPSGGEDSRRGGWCQLIHRAFIVQPWRRGRVGEFLGSTISVPRGTGHLEGRRGGRTRAH